MELHCLQCMIEIAQTAEAIANKEIPEDTEVPEIALAFTLAPMWQTTVVGYQTIMACVAVPVCEKHVSITRKTVQEQALGSGLLLPGPGMAVQGNG